MWNELERSGDAETDGGVGGDGGGEGIDTAVAQAFLSATSRLRAFATAGASKQLGSLLGGGSGSGESGQGRRGAWWAVLHCFFFFFGLVFGS